MNRHMIDKSLTFFARTLPVKEEEATANKPE